MQVLDFHVEFHEYAMSACILVTVYTLQAYLASIFQIISYFTLGATLNTGCINKNNH